MTNLSARLFTAKLDTVLTTRHVYVQAAHALRPVFTFVGVRLQHQSLPSQHLLLRAPAATWHLLLPGGHELMQWPHCTLLEQLACIVQANLTLLQNIAAPAAAAGWLLGTAGWVGTSCLVSCRLL